MVRKIKTFKELEDLKQECKNEKFLKKTRITISSGTCGQACGSLDIIAEFKKQIQRYKIDDKVILKITGCHGFCQVEPNILINPAKGLEKTIFYQRLKPADVEEIVSETILKNRVIERLLYVDSLMKKSIVYMEEIPFFKSQCRLLLRNNILIDPTDITDYLAIGGYTALGKVLSGMSPDEVIDKIKQSGLRGRGGGGFPTGKKWESCRNAKGSPKYIICNADEGDPGAFQDRSILEGNPHSIIEGMIIGGYAVGASEGYVYVRNEYPLAVRHIEIAIKQAEEMGLLGKDILGSNLRFTIKINRGGGAFVCGESSALMASIEGRLGEPRFKHIHATEKGLWDKPTTLNNVKTWACVPVIINEGAEKFANIGTDKSKGTMIFSLVGKINNTGLVEVPMGVSLRELIFDIGGGIPGKRRFKAVQIGGPSGGCIPEELLDLLVDYDSLTQAGSMMGSGSCIVMDEGTCMVDVAKYFLSFTKEESCGKCTPCREGTIHMLNILKDISEGVGKEADLELLEELGRMIKLTSLCGLGQSAPNPVLSTLRYFKDEYITHIKDKKCPAGICQTLIEYSIDKEKCTGCGVCRMECPQEAISGQKKVPHEINGQKCVKCRICLDICKFEAVKVS